MPDKRVINKGCQILTKLDLCEKFRRIGLMLGDSVMVHSSLSSMGYVHGGAEIIIGALVEVIGSQGTLIMPAFSPRVSDPNNWAGIDFEKDQLERARLEVPLFDLKTTPTTMGVIPETFRNWPGTIRSRHPQVSVCSNGSNARSICSSHTLEWGQGKGSPFERIYQMNAKVLLIGVGFNRVTLLHYAESLCPRGRRKVRNIPTMVNGSLAWLEAPDVGDDLNTHFPVIGEAFLGREKSKRLQIGQAHCELFSSKELIDFAVAYFDRSF